VKKEPQVSIIIVNHNAGNFLYDTLKSVYAQKGITYEVLVVDNLSTDDSGTMVKTNYQQVKWLQRQTNVGFSAANNLGVKNSVGKIILFLNPDASFTSVDALKKCYDKITSDPSIGIMTARVILSSTKKIDLTSHRGFPTPWASLTHFAGLSSLFPRSRIFNRYYKGYLGYEDEHEIDAVGGMFMLMSRLVGDKLGWWDEDYELYGEDIDLCYRASLMSYKVLYWPKVTIIHHKSISTGMSKHSKNQTTASRGTTKWVKAKSVEAMELFYRKHYLGKYPFFVNWLVLIGLKLMYLRRVILA